MPDQAGREATEPTLYRVKCEMCRVSGEFPGYYARESITVNHICGTSPAFWLTTPPARETTATAREQT